MDVFKLLSRGASIQTKHKKQLEIFQAEAPVEEANTDFFSKPKRKHTGARTDPAEEHKNGIRSQEDAAKFRSEHKIKVKGSDIPLPINSFNDLMDNYQLNENLRRNLVRYKFEDPTPIQSEAIPTLLQGRDLLACAPTGSGKTLAFLVPMLQKLCGEAKQKRLRALVVSPTRELTGQIYQVAAELAPRDLTVAHLNKAMLAKMRNNNAGKKANMDLLVSTPMRLIEAVKEQLIDLSHVEYLILDESDRLLGQGFVEQTDEIIAACTHNNITKAIFSATMPANVEELANSIMNSPIRTIIGYKEAASENVEQSLVFCGNEAGKLGGIRQMLREGDVVPPILVFVQSIQRAKALFHELVYDKVSVDVIHSDLTQNQRDRVVNSFKNGDVWVLICTDVLARGVDFHGVNLVINYDVPANAQSYVHRVGRTGRAGRKGKAVTFYTKQDIDSIQVVANVMKQSGCAVPEWLLQGSSGAGAGGRKKRQPVERAPISTVPRAIKDQKRKRTAMIEGSKRRRTDTQ